MKPGNERCSSRMLASGRSRWLVPVAGVCLAVACAATTPPPPWGPPSDTRIATLESKGGEKYLVYAPTEIRVPSGQDTKVTWYSDEGPFTIQTLDSEPFGNVHFVHSTISPPYMATAIVPHDTAKGIYRYAVGIFSVAEKKVVLDPRCPPIIVGP